MNKFKKIIFTILLCTFSFTLCSCKGNNFKKMQKVNEPSEMFLRHKTVMQNMSSEFIDNWNYKLYVSLYSAALLRNDYQQFLDDGNVCTTDDEGFHVFLNTTDNEMLRTFIYDLGIDMYNEKLVSENIHSGRRIFITKMNMEDSQKVLDDSLVQIELKDDEHLEYSYIVDEKTFELKELICRLCNKDDETQVRLYIITYDYDVEEPTELVKAREEIKIRNDLPNNKKRCLSVIKNYKQDDEMIYGAFDYIDNEITLIYDMENYELYKDSEYKELVDITSDLKDTNCVLYLKKK